MMPFKTRYHFHSKHSPEWKLTTVSVTVETTLVGVFITSLWWDSSRCHWYTLGSILSLNLSPMRWGISLLNKAISEDPKDSRDHRQAWEEQLAWCVEFQNTLSISDRSLIQTCHTEQQNLSIRVCLSFGRNFPESSPFNRPQSVTRGKCCFPSGIEFHTNWNFFFSNWFDLKGLVNELERKKNPFYHKAKCKTYDQLY